MQPDYKILAYIAVCVAVIWFIISTMYVVRYGGDEVWPRMRRIMRSSSARIALVIAHVVGMSWLYEEYDRFTTTQLWLLGAPWFVAALWNGWQVHKTRRVLLRLRKNALT